MAEADSRGGPPEKRTLSPLVVQYLYVHDPGEEFHYPSSRDRSGDPQRLALRYLECVLVQAASLRLRGVECELVLVTNLAAETSALGRAASKLLERTAMLDVRLVSAEYEHARPSTGWFAASRYVFDAIRVIAPAEDPDRPIWLLDVDCVWISPPRAFEAMPAPPAIGCVEIPYPPDWTTGANPGAIARLAEQMGAPPGPRPGWVGGELLAGRAAELIELLRACDELEAELVAKGVELETEEHLLTLARALGRVEMRDMEEIERIWTGARHGAPQQRDPAALAVWHLPSEKGLAFRRTARELALGRTQRVLRDLEDPQRAMRRFNVVGASPVRRVRDDLWLVRQRVADAARARLRAAGG